MRNRHVGLRGALRHLMTGAVVEKVATVASGLVLLRLLPLEEYGALVLAYSTFSLIDLAAGLAMNDLVVSRSASAKGSNDDAGSQRLVGSFLFWSATGLVAVAAAAAAAKPLLTAYLPSLDLYFWWVLVAGLTTPIRNLLITLFRVDHDFAAVKRTDIARSCGLAAGYVVFIGAAGWGLVGGLIAYIASSLLPVVLAVRPLSRMLHGIAPWLRPRPLMELMGDEGKWQAARYSITALHGTARPWLIQAVLGLEAVALFNAAKSVLGVPADLLPIKEALIPLMSREAAHPASLRRLYAQSLRYAVLVFGLLGLAIAAAAPFVFGWLFPQYREAVALIQLMSLSYLATGIATPQASVMYALRLQRFYFSTTMLNFVLLFALGIPLMLRFGVNGMGIAFVVGAAALSFLRERHLRAVCPALRVTARELLFARAPRAEPLEVPRWR